LRKFQSFLAPDIKSFIAYRKASRRWSDSYELNLFYFDRYCFHTYPTAKALTQKMVDMWCAQRETEINNSCMSRIYVIIIFVRYLRNRDKTDVVEPVCPNKERRTYIPHAFTADELKAFFKACDDLPSASQSRKVLYRKITVPVFFRLLYSSGIRTNEARLLKVRDVDLEQGVLSIHCSKGNSQHFVVLHDTMLDLMKRYDAVAQSLAPAREYFFASPDRPFYSCDWVCKNFRELWDKYNNSHATAYELRHNYATENINQYVGDGFDFDSKLVYLSKSMGHSVLKSTKYYYSLVPAMADIMEARTGYDFDDIVPKVVFEDIVPEAVGHG